jgi:hypothetical protein
MHQRHRHHIRHIPPRRVVYNLRRPYRVARRLPPPLLVLLGLVGVTAVVMGVMLLATLLIVGSLLLVPVLIAGLAVRAAVRNNRPPMVTGQVRPQQAVAPPRRAVAAVDPWVLARRDFGALRIAYAEYECDPLAVLRLPALADVSVPSTARFIEAFAEAQALDTETPPPPQHKAQYLAAVDRARRTWTAAREAAERIQSSHLPPQERATVERVVRLLTTARDSDNDAERLVAYAKARNELTRLERTGRFRLPRLAKATLDAASRGQLPA